MTKRDYYEILGVARDADEATIKRAYRSLAMKYHPDRNPGDKQAIEKMKEINEAYAVLTDPEKRRLYDAFGHAGLEGYSTADIYRGIDFDSIFREFGLSDFGFGFGDSIFDSVFGTGKSGRGRSKGADLRYDLEVGLEDIAFGANKQIEIQRTRPCNLCLGTGASPRGLIACDRCKGTGQIVFERRSGYSIFRQINACSKCRGTGNIVTEKCSVCQGNGLIYESKEIQIKVPQGADDGYVIKVRGEGEPGGDGAAPGDLYVVLRLKKHPSFEKHGDDLYTTKEISFVQAALGDKIEVQGLYGPVRVAIPEGTQTDTVLRIPNQGLPRFGGESKGDLYVRVKIVTPQNLTHKEKELLREFDKLQKEKQAKRAETQL